MSRVFKRGKDHWIDFNDARGVRHRRKIGRSKRVAQEVLDGLLGNVARRQHLGIIEESAISFADFSDIWWERIKQSLKPRTQERWLGIKDKHLKPAFTGALRAVNQTDAERYIARRLKPRVCSRCEGKQVHSGNIACPKCGGSGEFAGATASTINREVTVLKHIIRRAVSWEFLSRNPFLDSQGGTVEGMKPLREPSGRVRFLTLDEIECLLTVCESVPYLKSFAVVAMNTGMRRNEILSLTRKSIDWQNRIATLSETKNGETGHVPLNEPAYQALKSLPPRIDSDRLFPFNPNQVSVSFKRAVRRAKIEDFRLHDLRHTFASYQTMAGTQGRGVQALLRHKDGRMTARYSHLSDAYLRTAVNNVALGSDREKPAAPTPQARV